VRTKIGQFTLEGGLTYKGQKIPESIEFDPTQLVVRVSSSHYYGKKLNEHERIRQVNMDYWPTTIFVKNWGQTKFTATTKKKLIKWHDAKKAAGKYQTINSFVFVPADFKDPNIDKANIIDWLDIKSIKIEYQKVQTAAGQIRRSRRRPVRSASASTVSTTMWMRMRVARGRMRPPKTSLSMCPCSTTSTTRVRLTLSRSRFSRTSMRTASCSSSFIGIAMRSSHGSSVRIR
jgi:hypothetical protein